VVLYDGNAYSLEFDGAEIGLPAGSFIDALSHAPDGDLLMSLDVTVAFSTAYAVSAFTAADEDILRWDPTDGVHMIHASQHLVLSFDGSGVAGGMHFDDDDVLEYDTQSRD